MKIKISEISPCEIISQNALPSFSTCVPAGFPSPAEDHMEMPLDLNKHLINNPAATFFVRVSGDSMINAGIHHNDLLVVDRSLEPRNDNIVIAVINGELTVKRLKLSHKKLALQPENKQYQTQEITPEMDFHIWGVVTSVVHKL